MQITLEALNDPPRVIVTVTGAPDGAVYLDIQRDVGEWTHRLRGVVLVGSECQVVDWDVPTGRDVSYTARCRNIGNQIVATASAGIETLQVLDLGGGRVRIVGEGVTVADDGRLATLTGPTVELSADGLTATVTATGIMDPPCSDLWISDPLDQASAMLVRAEVGTFGAVPFPADIRVAQPVSGDFPYASVQARTTVGQLRMHLRTEGDTTRKLIAMFRHAPSVCIRMSSRAPGADLLPPMFYAAANPVGAPWALSGKTRWAVDLTPSRGPGVAPIANSWTWDDLESTGMTWDDLQGTGMTWFEAARGLPHV